MVMEVTDQLHPWAVELREDGETEPQNSCHVPGLTISSQRKEQGGKKSPSLLISSPLSPSLIGGYCNIGWTWCRRLTRPRRGRLCCMNTRGPCHHFCSTELVCSQTRGSIQKTSL